MNENTRTTLIPLLTVYSILACCIGWWFFVAFDLSINADIVYLTQSAGYFLSGEKMVDAYYDNNPPLCILMYVIPAALIKYFAVPMTVATPVYNLAFVFLSSLLVFEALRSITTLKNSEKHIITILYILTNTVAANHYFGEKDQYIILGLFPFVLLQIIITYEYKIGRSLKIAILCLGTISLMIKAHFYIVPAIFILHRIIKNKSIMAIFKSDSIALCIGAGLYLLALLTYFQDYTTQILPDALQLYATMKEQWVLVLSGIMAFIIGIGAFCTYFLPQKPYKFAAFFLFLSIVCIVPYALQGKGFYYHLLPALIFFACGFGLAVFQSLSGLLHKISTYEKYEAPLILLVGLLFFSGYFSLFYSKQSGLTHEEYKQSVLAQAIRQCPRDHCSYFMFNDMIEITQQLSVYTDQPHASRFASFWFLPELLLPSHALTDDRKSELSQKYSTLVAQDFKKFKPDTLILGQFNIDPQNPSHFDFIDFFSASSPEFAQEIKEYSFEKTLEIDMATYFPETLVESNAVKFDIYRRNYAQNP